MLTEPPLVEARGIGRRAAGGGEWLIHDIDFRILAGDWLALVGPTGSGKTLLLRALALLDPLDAGKIYFQRERVTGPEIPAYRSRVIYLHQRPALPEGTVDEILRQPWGLRVHHAGHYDRERVLELLSWLKRGEAFLRKEQRTLSGGESQLVALLRAIQLDPRVLLLDEATAALDGDTAAAVESLVCRWRDETSNKRATLWVTHAPRQAGRVASQVLRFEAGRLVREP